MISNSLKHPAMGLALASVLSLGAGTAQAQADISVAPSFNTWDFNNPVGVARLVRTDSGISAVYQAADLPMGQAITLWFVVFNNPSECSTSPCGVSDLLANPAAEADFLWGAGDIIGRSGNASFGGHLSKGRTSRSAFIELGMPEAALGLTNPRGAEVHLMLHSHGPAASGRTLRQQLSSFLGGCEVILGSPEGIALTPDDMPSELGECSTFQVSVHE